MTSPSKTAVTPKAPADPASLVKLDAAIFNDVEVELDAKLGRVSLSIRQLMDLKAGAVLELDLKINDLVDLRLNQSTVARGEIVAVGDHFGVRIVQVAQLK